MHNKKAQSNVVSTVPIILSVGGMNSGKCSYHPQNNNGTRENLLTS